MSELSHGLSKDLPMWAFSLSDVDISVEISLQEGGGWGGWICNSLIRQTESGPERRRQPRKLAKTACTEGRGGCDCYIVLWRPIQYYYCDVRIVYGASLTVQKSPKARQIKSANHWGDLRAKGGVVPPSVFIKLLTCVDQMHFILHDFAAYFYSWQYVSYAAAQNFFLS